MVPQVKRRGRSHNDDRRTGKAPGFPPDSGKGAAQRPFPCHCGGSIRRLSRRDQPPSKLLQPGKSHQKHQRPVKSGQPVKILGQAVRGAGGVSRHHMKRPAEPAAGHRNSGQLRRGNAGRDPRHNLKRNACFAQRFRLLAAPPEHKRVPAFQTAYLLPPVCQLDQEGADLLLGQAVPAAALADVVQLRIRTGLFQQAVGQQVVINHRIRPPQAFQPPDGDQIPREASRPHQHNRPCHSFSSQSCRSSSLESGPPFSTAAAKQR